MSDPRIPESKEREAQLPDDLDQLPAVGQSQEPVAQHGSGDAQLLAEGAAAGYVENAAAAEAAPPDDLGRTND